MGIARPPSPSPEDLQWLRQQASSTMAPRRLAERCRLVLLSADGKNHEQMAAALGITRQRSAVGRRRPRGGAPALSRRDGPAWKTTRPDGDAKRSMAAKCRR